MRLLAVADLHLGAGAEFGRQPYGPDSRLADQERVWLRACQLAAEEDVELVLFAGDAFHRRRPSPSEILAFAVGLEALASHGIPVVAIDGNHDVISAELPSALSIFSSMIDLHRTPDVVHRPALSIACLPWTPPGRLVASLDGGDRDEIHRDVAQLLLDTARGLRAQCPDDRPAILLAHWSVSGGRVPSGVATGELREPVLSLHELAAQGWDAVILGHIHVPDVLHEWPPILYCGSPAAVDFGEANVPHGVWLLDVDGQGQIARRYVDLGDRPLISIDVDLTPLDPGEDLTGVVIGHAGLHDLRGAVVRVRYRATGEQAQTVDQQQIRAALADAGVHRLYAIQADVIRDDRARVEGLTEDVSPMQALEMWLATQDGIPAWISESVRERAARYLEEVGA